MLIDDKKHSDIISAPQAINLVKSWAKFSCFLNTQQVIPQLAVKWCPWSMCPSLHLFEIANKDSITDTCMFTAHNLIPGLTVELSTLVCLQFSMLG